MLESIKKLERYAMIFDGTTKYEIQDLADEIQWETDELERALNEAAGKWAKADGENAELRQLVLWMRDKWAYSIDGYYGNLLEECDERMKALGLEVD